MHMHLWPWTPVTWHCSHRKRFYYNAELRNMRLEAKFYHNKISYGIFQEVGTVSCQIMLHQPQCLPHSEAASWNNLGKTSLCWVMFLALMSLFFMFLFTFCHLTVFLLLTHSIVPLCAGVKLFWSVPPHRAAPLFLLSRLPVYWAALFLFLRATSCLFLSKDCDLSRTLQSVTHYLVQM